MSQIVSIVYKPENALPTEEGYTRIPVQQTTLVVDGGIKGDVKGKSPKRQLNLMAAHCLEQLATEGFQTAPGEMGEQLIVAGIELDALPPGTQLQLGEQACVELVEPRTGCAKFERYQGKKREEAAGRLGMMARVVKGGEIAVGDAVAVVAQTA